MIDIDHFKNFNDKYGHRIGDQALAAVGAAVKKTCEVSNTPRRVVLFARLGGEEFAVIVAGWTDSEINRLAQDLCQRVAQYNFVIRDANGHIIENRVQLTISVGAAMADPAWNHPDQLVDAADSLLYNAKRGGRNRVCC
jgi:diguanylate cyclase (GGDEF)-like protein